MGWKDTYAVLIDRRKKIKEMFEKDCLFDYLIDWLVGVRNVVDFDTNES